MMMTACPACRLDLTGINIGGAVSYCPRCGCRLLLDLDHKTQPSNMAPDQLALLLARYLAVGKLEAAKFLPVLRELLPTTGENLSHSHLLDVLLQTTTPAAQELYWNLFRQQLRFASMFHDWLQSGNTVKVSQWPLLAHLPLCHQRESRETVFHSYFKKVIGE